jgi:hypothetical protein
VNAKMAPVTTVKRLTDARLDQACLAFGTVVETTGGQGRPDSHPFRRSGQNSANEGCSPIVLSIA